MPRHDTLAPPPEPQAPTIITYDADRAVSAKEIDTDFAAVEEPTPGAQDSAADTAADDRERVLAFDRHAFSIQLVAARNAGTLAELKTRYAHLGEQLFQVRETASGLQLLLYGVFSSRNAAQAAVDTMVPAPEEPPWIRVLGPLQESIR